MIVTGKEISMISLELLREIFEKGADSARQGTGQVMPDSLGMGLLAVYDYGWEHGYAIG